MKKLLIVIDYQNDFVSGSLGFKEAIDIEENICKLIESFKNSGDDVIFTYDTHPNNYLETQEGRNLPVVHCVKDTEGWNLYGKVNDLSQDCIKIEKPTFPSLQLGNYIKDKDYKEVTMCGVVSNICVISNAVIVKAALPEAKIIINKKATASNDPKLHEMSMEIMKNLHMEIKE